MKDGPRGYGRPGYVSMQDGGVKSFPDDPVQREKLDRESRENPGRNFRRIPRPVYDLRDPHAAE